MRMLKVNGKQMITTVRSKIAPKQFVFTLIMLKHTTGEVQPSMKRVTTIAQ